MVFSPDRFNHPNIVHIIEIVQADDDIFVVMEYLPGRSLQEILDESKRTLDVREALHMGMHIAEALDYVHNAGILHRDIKPVNIMIIAGNADEPSHTVSSVPAPLTSAAVKLIDFGLADIVRLPMNPDHQSCSGRFPIWGTGEKDVFATFAYISPEQVREHGPGPDERSDLYSLGILLYLLATNTLPFCRDDIQSIIYQHIAKIPDPSIEKNHAISRTFSDIILKLLEKEPELRYQTARGLLNDFERVRGGEIDFEIGRHDRPRRLVFLTRPLNISSGPIR